MDVDSNKWSLHCYKLQQIWISEINIWVKSVHVRDKKTYLKAQNIAPSNIYSHKYVNELFSR